MKNLLLVLILISASYSTIDAQVYAVAATPTEFAKQKESGKFTFRFGSDVLPENVLSNADNFKDFFACQFDGGTYVGTFTLTENKEMNRLMLGRYLIGLGIEVIEYDGQQTAVTTFTTDHLK